jgi:hypothetical protein
MVEEVKVIHQDPPKVPIDKYLADGAKLPSVPRRGGSIARQSYEKDNPQRQQRAPQ